MGDDVRRTIRGMQLRLGMHASPRQVAERLAACGVAVSESLVAAVKAQMLRQQAAAEREQAKRAPTTKSRRRPQQRKIPRGRG